MPSIKAQHAAAKKAARQQRLWIHQGFGPARRVRVRAQRCLFGPARRVHVRDQRVRVRAQRVPRNRNVARVLETTPSGLPRPDPAAFQ